MIDQHAKGQKEKIEVPTDTQPQLELGDTAEDIERRRKREERGKRERREQEERDREGMERKSREENQERAEKRARTDTDTDVESTQSSQKKSQMKSIFPSDSDEEAIVEIVKQHEELYDKTNNRQAEERKTLGAASSYQKLACQDCEEVVRYSTYQIWQTHSDEVRTSS